MTLKLVSDGKYWCWKYWCYVSFTFLSVIILFLWKALKNNCHMKALALVPAHSIFSLNAITKYQGTLPGEFWGFFSQYLTGILLVSSCYSFIASLLTVSLLCFFYKTSNMFWLYHKSCIYFIMQNIFSMLKLITWGFKFIFFSFQLCVFGHQCHLIPNYWFYRSLNRVFGSAVCNTSFKEQSRKSVPLIACYFM